MEDDDGREETEYARELQRSYKLAFPAARVEVQTLSTARGWSPQTAARCVAALSSVPVIDHCLHRGEVSSEHTCIPHLICDCTRVSAETSLPDAVLEKILTGRKLTQREKAVLSMIEAEDRALFTVAYAANRCMARGYPKACVLFFFEADGGGHANMLHLRAADGGLLEVVLYEPNGAEASESYGTVARFFPDFASRLQRLLPEGSRATFDVVGLALQTFLGRTSVRRTRQAVFVSKRGYPVCTAVVLWFFSRYVTDDSADDLPAYEREFMRRGRGELKAELLAWVQDLVRWVRANYEELMSAELAAVFGGSNVVAATLRYGTETAVYES